MSEEIKTVKDCPKCHWGGGSFRDSVNRRVQEFLDEIQTDTGNELYILREQFRFLNGKGSEAVNYNPALDWMTPCECKEGTK